MEAQAFVDEIPELDILLVCKYVATIHAALFVATIRAVRFYADSVEQALSSVCAWASKDPLQGLPT